MGPNGPPNAKGAALIAPEIANYRKPGLWGHTPPQVKCRCALVRSGYAQYLAHHGRAFVWLGFRRMQSDFSGPGVLWAIQQNSYVKLD